MNFDDDEDEPEVNGPVAEAPVAPPSSNSAAVKSKGHGETPAVVDRSNTVNQDDWEEFEDPNAKYEELRAKFSRANPNDDDEDEDGDYDHHDDPMANDENQLHAAERAEQRKDKPVWKLDQVKANEVTNANVPEEASEAPRPPSPVKPSSNAYRPPQLRSGAAVAIVSGPPVRVSKKKQPNLASTEDFPTLGAAVNKK